MKTIGTLFAIICISFSMNSQEFKFEKETIDYGKIVKSSNGERTFVFKNIGEQPIIINKIQSSCGCTVPEKPKKPIMPGEKGEIKVSYDTNREGGFSKQITIYSNAKTARKIIKIKGLVAKGVDLEKEKSMLSNN
jgi:hypothetical protein